MDMIKLTEPPEHLLKDVLLRAHEEKHLVRIHVSFIFFCTLLVSSGLGVITGLASVMQTLLHNGFSQLLSLISTDGSIVFAAWQDYLLSLLETIPVTTILLVLILATLFLVSLHVSMREYKRVAPNLIFANH